MARIGVFVGSSPLSIEGTPVGEVDTPWGAASAAPILYERNGHELLLMRRHGDQHQFAPHQINYRANVWLMRELALDYLVGTYTVGSVDPQLNVADLIVPHQLIDYSWGRDSTYDDVLRHVEFSDPYDQDLRALLLGADAAVLDGGVYACTQGPRLETAAEIVRLARDGATLVGMTGMPEAALARELELKFAGLCLVVNPAAGVADDVIDMDALRAVSQAGGQAMLEVLLALLDGLA